MIIEKAREKLREMVVFNGLSEERIDITCRALTSEEAIGNPMHDDYPIQKGKERMIEAEFMGKNGQAFTGSCSNYKLSVRDLLDMNLNSDARRAIFISSLNSILAYLEIIPEAIHCKNDDLVKCADSFSNFLCREGVSGKKILLVGLRPGCLKSWH